MSVNATKGKQSFTDGLAINDSDTNLGGADLADDMVLDPLAGAGERKRFSGGSIVLAIVIVVAIGGLWFMRSLSHVNAGTSGSTDLEKKFQLFLDNIGKSGGDRSSKGGEIVRRDPKQFLAENITQRQVPLDGVQKNPFILPGEDPSVHQGTPAGDDDSVKSRKARAERQAFIEQAAAQLQLKSVIMGSTPIANISGKIIRQGDAFETDEGVVFRILEITPDSANLEASDPAFDLKVSVTVWLRPDR